jgi:fatty acid desaturase
MLTGEDGNATMLSTQEVRELSGLSSWHTVQALAFDWALIVAAFALAIAFPNPAVWVVSLLLVARQQLALAIMMHDAAHKRLFASVKTNDNVGQFLCAAPLLFSMYSYRTLHLRHHKEPLTAEDPDLSLIGGYPINKRSFVRKLLRDATGVSYFKFIRYFIHMAGKQKSRTTGSEPNAKRSSDAPPTAKIVFSIVLVNSLMLAALSLLGHPWLYLTLWLLPAITALQVLLRIRGIAEHAGYQATKNQMLCSRTVTPSWQTVVFAPHSVNYHIEHHVYPSIPHYNLTRAHKMMRERAILPEENIYSGYDKVLQELVI